MTWESIQLGLVALVFGGLQVWCRTHHSRSVAELHMMASGHRAVLDGSAFFLSDRTEDAQWLRFYRPHSDNDVLTAFRSIT